MTRWWRLVAGCWALLLSVTGCLHRRLVIKSDPPGADVVLNDQRVGATPYDEPFDWYGWHRVTLMKSGYQRLDDRVLLRAPRYAWIPLDLVVEMLPVQVRDTKTLAYRLLPAEPLPEPVPPVTEPPQEVEGER